MRGLVFAHLNIEAYSGRFPICPQLSESKLLISCKQSLVSIHVCLASLCPSVCSFFMQISYSMSHVFIAIL